MTINLAALYEFRTTPRDPDAQKHSDDLVKALTSPVNGRACKGCPNTLTRRHDESWARFDAREYCSSGCAGRANGLAGAAARREQKLEDAEWIIGTDSAENVAVRLGYKDVANLAQVLKRWGRTDLVERLYRTQVAA